MSVTSGFEKYMIFVFIYISRSLAGRLVLLPVWTERSACSPLAFVVFPWEPMQPSGTSSAPPPFFVFNTGTHTWDSGLTASTRMGFRMRWPLLKRRRSYHMYFERPNNVIQYSRVYPSVEIHIA